MSSSKAARGSAEICGKGNMTASTARAIQCGTNVTLSCHLRDLRPPGRCRVGIFLNDSGVRSRGPSVSRTFLVNTHGRHTFTCKTVCGDTKSLVCGIDIKCGNPPDEPGNVSCIQTGMDGHPLCTWDKGRLTHIDTTYVIRLSNGTHEWCFAEESLNDSFGSLALSRLNFDSNYTVVVSASNKLGNASSQPLTFMLIDIGKVETFSSDQFHLHGLEPDTAYEFQVSCKIHPERGLWSDWSTSQARTPEAEPRGTVDLWYRQQDVGSQQQNISLFWKALSKSEAGGRILGYTVTFEALEQQNPPTESHHTTQTSYSRLTPRRGYRITVTAQNSRGRSPPASTLTHLGIQDLPPPQQVSAVAMGNSSILVSWRPPLRSAVPVSGYVVEWAETPRNPHLEPQHTWAKLPPSNLSAVIAEHIKDHTCYQIHVFALYQGRAGQAASIRGYSSAQAPSAGPQVFPTPRGSGVLVSWEEIPAAQRGGCITGYRVYLRSEGSQRRPQAYAVPAGPGPGSLFLPDLRPGLLYELWVTGSTAAGEGPRGSSARLRLPAAEGWMTLVLTCSFFIFSACVCSLPPARKMFLSLLSALLPQWQSKAIPDPANATWAKSFMATKGELSSPSSLFLPSTVGFEEPEPTPVEDALVPPEPSGLGDKLLVGSAGSGGHGDWAPESPGPEPGDEQQLPELYQRLVVEAMELPQPEPGYISSPGPAELPPGTEPAGERPELQCHPLSLFPATFVPPALCCKGNLTLDRVKLSCSSSPREVGDGSPA
ncbi:interleukin 12 receptor subunit beta 2 [Willisornis vidua]|uniref:Interleukin 12 receptor subunit beta 2 n=1 Tax=Willisornis vidua TaxID=1566151 RepID=A0ABQ9DLM6_9PASS|nr:interleukin 12 receptor subunit beta 2 [Willisornis vidua]